MYFALLTAEKLLKKQIKQRNNVVVDHKLEKNLNSIISIIKHLIQFDINQLDHKNHQKIADLYNKEIDAEMTLLWKAVQLDLVPIIDVLLAPIKKYSRSLFNINNTTSKYNRTALM